MKADDGTPLPVRRLGDLRLPAQGLGCLSMTSFYARADPAEARATVRRAIDRGVTLLDTADVQGLGEGERLLGEAVAGRRDRVLISTKVGLERDQEGEFLGVRGDRGYIRQRCHASLRRLGVDHLDFYVKHWAAPGERIEEAFGALAELVTEGKVRHLCLSEVSAATIRRAHAVHPVTAVQSEWSLWSRGIEAEVVPVCRELGIGIIASCPLGRGFLTGSIGSAADLGPAQDFRHGLPRFGHANLARNQAVLAALRHLAASRDLTVAQLALAWLHQQGDDVVPIPGTARRDHLEENLAAALVELTPDERQAVAAAVPPEAVHGDRYPPFLMRLVDN
ncbi:aldo/keto reductase [Streptomyces spectabilis]|uniref:Aldo/keto reductase n=1 Tax=Streptomyces spectabilis TaxID=68270 RepID=A0A5P2X4D1_STRST|nr:aldo/keto reductase [Streptomyces spectabilis]MBB5107927.1 aryl-alcohol dehydrogenase-like predicted oxidoreductase [Streptomyces spectabilis]MCI3899743.1 aldo/keto reductase [Streptomyces spectabilis]QEV57416.1 aldo/keto reductase [Streptomyces spectabilis]GGV52092.1 aldo/keto reductase [Streptomyces spectabilis]